MSISILTDQSKQWKYDGQFLYYFEALGLYETLLQLVPKNVHLIL
jgi:hypothetical protein